MTDPAAEAAFEQWLREHPPGTANVHTAFVAGRESMKSFRAGCAVEIVRLTGAAPGKTKYETVRAIDGILARQAP